MSRKPPRLIGYEFTGIAAARDDLVSLLGKMRGPPYIRNSGQRRWPGVLDLAGIDRDGFVSMRKVAEVVLGNDPGSHCLPIITLQRHHYLGGLTCSVSLGA